VSSIQLNGTGPTNAVDLAKIATTSPAAAQHAADVVDSAKDAGDRTDIIPSKPPESLLDQVTAAGQRFQELRDQQRELHFTHDDETNRVVVQVRDLDGNVLRTIPPSKALDVISGAPLD
jgi:flagellar protein FlaG